ncbi:MAG: LEA type 2 family protein [Gemmatimonadota bacterium]|nr:LEA type 2 family protein [Gemmatimonadota bacterium]MDH5758162.1 LEA type 2 family protein [Gemmatimonadota bacterium]
MTFRRWAPASAVLLMAAGCAVAFQEPTVEVAGVRVASIGLRGGTLAVSVEVDNPNRYDLEVRYMSFAVDFVDGEAESDAPLRPLVEGRLDDPPPIPAKGSGTVEVEVPLEYSSVGSAIRRILSTGELGYRFRGELRFDVPWGTMAVPLEDRGVFRPEVPFGRN